MPADFSPYVDLVPYDQSPTDIYLAAIEFARLTLPQFELRQGTPDDAMIQAFSMMSALNVGAINRLPPRLMEGIIRMMGVQRDEGRRATVTALASISTYNGLTIPSNTVFIYKTQIDGVDSEFSFQTISDTTFASGDPETDPYPEATLYLESTYVGVHPPIPDGAELIMQTIIPDIVAVYANDDFNNGATAEDDYTYLSRAREYLSSISGATATASQIRSSVLSNISTVSKLKVYDLTDGDGTLNISDPIDPGKVAIFVWGFDRQLTSSELYDVLVYVSDKSTAGLTFTVANFTPIEFGVTVNYAIDIAYNSLEMADLVKTAIVDIMSPGGFDTSIEAIKMNEIASVVRGIEGVRYVDSIQLADTNNLATQGLASINSNGDIIFTKKGLIANIGTGDIAVNTTVI